MYEIIHGTEVVWQKPSENPKGVLFIAHGCNHGAIDFWPPLPGCPACTGLPEEVNITRRALDRGYAVVAISSQERRHNRCWQLDQHSGPEGPAHKESVDVEKVKAVLSTLLPRERLQQAPLYALGGSSGGALVLVLARWLPSLAAVCSQIMGVPSGLMTDLLQQRAAAAGGGAAYPPVLFVHMPRDEYTAELVAANQAMLQAQGVRSSIIPILPRPVTPDFLAARVPQLAPGSRSGGAVPGGTGKAAALVEAFRAAGLLDEQGFLLDDPRRSHWRQVAAANGVPDAKPAVHAKVHIMAGGRPQRLYPPAPELSEVLNLAYGGHELASDTTDLMLDWFEQGGSNSSE